MGTDSTEQHLGFHTLTLHFSVCRKPSPTKIAIYTVNKACNTQFYLKRIISTKTLVCNGYGPQVSDNSNKFGNKRSKIGKTTIQCLSKMT